MTANTQNFDSIEPVILQLLDGIKLLSQPNASDLDRDLTSLTFQVKTF